MGGLRALNPVSIFLLLLVAGAGYAVYTYGPLYLVQSKIETALGKACAELYQARGKSGPKLENTDALQRRIHEKLRELDILDPEAVVEFETNNPDYILGRASYTVVIEHPIIHRFTVHRFHPEAKVDAKRVDWDKM